jgi:predicted ATPase
MLLMTPPPIFISFSSKDRKIAETICDALESRGYPCWISCRNIGPGENFQEAIVKAIRSASTMILVFTANANNSDEIKKEVVLAGQHKLVLIPLRVEDIVPQDAFAYEFATRQWIDMFGDWERAIDRLAGQIGSAVRMTPARPAPEPVAPEAPSTNLPQLATALIGRQTELDEIKTRIESHRLVTLLGSGGIGKTRIALQAGADLAGRFPDGVWLLELAPVTDPALVAEMLCGLLGVPATGTRPAVEIATGYLRQKKLLLILDNCEHLVATAAQLADALFKRCPEVSILATSREILAVPGEAVYRMPSLGIPPDAEGIAASEALQFGAVQLFVERAAAALGSYTLSDADAPSVAAICRRLDGLALAIELAAPRLKILRPPQLLEKLSDRFRVLTGGSRTMLPRQQTLRALIDWSYDLLSEPERTLLRRLSVFAGGCSLEGAVAVAEGDPVDEWEVIDLLSGLVDKSLVVADPSGAEPRYRLLESTRHYAFEKLRESGETGRRRRLAEYLIGFYDRAEATWPTTPTDPWLAEYAPELDNLRFAIDWGFGPDGDPALGVALVARADKISAELSLIVERSRWAAIALPHVLPSTAKADALRINFIANRLGKFGMAGMVPIYRALVELAREGGDALLLGTALHSLAACLSGPGELGDEARSLWEEALRVSQSAGPTKRLGSALNAFGAASAISGDLAAARRLMEEGLAIARRLGDRGGLLSCASNIAHLDFIEGDVARAIERAEEAVGEARRQNVKSWLCELCSNLVGYLLVFDRIEQARAVGREGLVLARALERQDTSIEFLERLALAAALGGTVESAARLLGFTDAWYTASGAARDEAVAGDCDRLKRRLGESLSQDRIDTLMAEGAGWSPDDAAKAALAG